MYKTSFHFFSKLKNVSREQLLSFIETAVNLHPHLRELLPSDAAAAAGPPAPPVPPPDADTPWCHCGRCRQMPRPEEQLCCRRRAGECILQTAHNELNDVVLRRNVLLVAVRHINDLFAYNEQPGNDNFRHSAYRQFVLWRFDRLGSGNRVVIPSCVVWAIRDLYPSADGVYTGFKVARFT